MVDEGGEVLRARLRHNTLSSNAYHNPHGTLELYRSKRRFKATPEPRGRVTKGKAHGLTFVIQKHAARRLHFDFRLELNGVLLSWAVPKGPSLDPNDKRLAVHVEDHPIEYGEFEGVIPPKQYGSGTVLLWDRGIWLPKEDPDSGYQKGKLKFELRGAEASRWLEARSQPRWPIWRRQELAAHQRG